jgi:choline kinase
MKQIAKRMRELHDGIDLLDEERENGPMVFHNWDKWVDRCEQVISWVDAEIKSPLNEGKAASEPWRRRGYVCGVPWPKFRKAVEDYRKWLIVDSGGVHEIKRQLVFGHNDVGSETGRSLPSVANKLLVDTIWQLAAHGA